MAQPALKLASRERLPSRIEFEIAVPVLDGKGILSLVLLCSQSQLTVSPNGTDFGLRGLVMIETSQPRSLPNQFMPSI